MCCAFLTTHKMVKEQNLIKRSIYPIFVLQLSLNWDMLWVVHTEGRTIVTTTLHITPKAHRKAASTRICTLADLQSGETGRIIRVEMPDVGCRKRFAELGLASGMTVTVTGGGDTILLAIGGARMGLGRNCAMQITVMKIDA